MQHSFAIGKRIAHAPLPKRRIEGIVGILRKHPNTDFGSGAEKAAAEIFAARAEHINDIARLRTAGRLPQVAFIQPRVPCVQPARSPICYNTSRILSLFHKYR
mgnify:CR=1 FL=1